MAILSEDRWLAMATVFVEEDGERIAYLRESFIDLTADDSEWLTVSRPLIDEFFRLLVAEGIARVYTDTLADRPRVIRYLEATGARRTGVERPSATGDIPAVEFVWDIAEIAPQSASTN
ncbi:hypothetical protein KEM60_00056 [Austwickia sp. TVS 96-490-7B]|nr:hypothetical protein [Austwickia sp. TVS 96-490-7B]